MQPNEISEVRNRPLSQELLDRDLTRPGYVAKDGTPRTIPIGFTRNGSELVEPSAALGIAAILGAPQRFAGQRVTTILLSNVGPADLARWVLDSAAR